MPSGGAIVVVVGLVAKLRGVKRKGRKHGNVGVSARGDGDCGLDCAKKCRLSDGATVTHFGSIMMKEK